MTRLDRRRFLLGGGAAIALGVIPFLRRRGRPKRIRPPGDVAPIPWIGHC